MICHRLRGAADALKQKPGINLMPPITPDMRPWDGTERPEAAVRETGPGVEVGVCEETSG